MEFDVKIKILRDGAAVPLHTIKMSGFAAFIFARSGLGIKHGIAPANCVGVIDSDYRGEVCVGLHNYSKEEYTVNPGDRVAQMAIMPVAAANFVVAKELDDTDRGHTGRRRTAYQGHSR